MPQRNIWDDISGCTHDPIHWMGAWLHYRKAASIAYVPDTDLRAQLKGKYPQDYVFNYALNPQQTGDARCTIMQNWVLMGMVCSATQDGEGAAGSSIQAQIYIGRNRQGVALSDRPIQGENQFGTAGFVRWLRVPLWIPPQTPILVRVQNLDATPSVVNNIEIALQGVGD
jgi:hypothetical protein